MNLGYEPMFPARVTNVSPAILSALSRALMKADCFLRFRLFLVIPVGCGTEDEGLGLQPLLAARYQGWEINRPPRITMDARGITDSTELSTCQDEIPRFNLVWKRWGSGE